MGIYRDALDEGVGYLAEYAEVTAVYAEDQEQIDKILNLSDRLPKLKYILYSDPRGVRKITDPRLRAIDDLIQQGAELARQDPSAHDALVAATNGNDICILCTTSGTTANPKLAMLSHQRFIRHNLSYLASDPKTPRDDVIALAFHVDYWDYIGWKDRFSLAAARLRQQAYAKSMHARHIFTPQLIVAGNTSVVGSDRDAVEHAIKAAHKTHEGQPSAPKIALTRGAKEVTLTLSESMQSPPANIWLLAYDDRHVTQIPRGENAGRTLIDHHAVRAIVNLGTWDGTETSRQIAARHWPADSDHLAIVLQADNHGRILAAATLPLREIP